MNPQPTRKMVDEAIKSTRELQRLRDRARTDGDHEFAEQLTRTIRRRLQIFVAGGR